MAGGSSTSGSVFRVGDNVELWRVIGMVSVLLVFVMIFEHFVHKLEHHLKKYPKYHEMMTKVFGELMILGLIGLGIKILKELGQLDLYSKSMIAFQAADLTIFIVAIGLIIQSTIVFLRIRRKNIQMDKAELISSAHLVDHMARTRMPTWVDEIGSFFTYLHRQNLRTLTPGDVPEVAKMRIVRHYFLRCYGLPELFPFSKYLRQAQDNQISHMIEVEMSTWIILLLIAWALDAVTAAIHDHAQRQYAIVLAYVAFSWTSVLLNIAITMYFTWAVDQLLTAAVTNKSSANSANRYLYLNEIAEEETAVTEQEYAVDAIAVMQRVREQESLKKTKRHRKYLTKHDTGFQLVATVLRKVTSKASLTSKGSSKQVDGGESGHVDEVAVPTGMPPIKPRIQLKWFSRKAWHFVVMTTLMLNAFYFALFCQCVLYQMSSLKHDIGVAPLFLIPLPMLINMFVFQPRILRNFILVSCVCRVDDAALGEVIDHFTETVQLRADFVTTVHEYLANTNQALEDIQRDFEERDPQKTGYLNLDELRLVLQRFGFKLSFFKFNSVAKLLFDLSGIVVEYAQVIKLLEVGRTPELRSLYTAGQSRRSSALDSIHDSRAHAASFVLLDTSTHEETTPVVDGFTHDTTSQTRNNLLPRTKSSVLTTLYRFDTIDDGPRIDEHGSPVSAQYVRM